MKLNKLTIIIAAGMLIHSFAHADVTTTWIKLLQKKTEDLRKKKVDEQCQQMEKKHPDCKRCCQKGLICCIKNNGKFHTFCKTKKEGCPIYHGLVS